MSPSPSLGREGRGGSPIMLTFSSLTIGYKNHIIAEDITATLQKGSLSCLLGVNGCGKSTLLRTMCGFLPPVKGEIYLDGIPMSTLSAQEKARKVSIVLTHNDEARDLTVWDIVAMGRSPYTGFWGRLNDDDKAIVARSLEMVSISTELHSRRITEISDGERQKVMIAKAIAQQTPVILLDEPTAFLDYPSKGRMFTLLGQVARDMDKAILLSTHDLEHAKKYGDIAWVMTEGKLHCSSFETAKRFY